MKRYPNIMMFLLMFVISGCVHEDNAAIQAKRALINKQIDDAIAEQNAEDAHQLAALKTKAENGDAEAQCKLGVSYMIGQKTTKDAVEAVKWFQKAAAQNYSKAEYDLGLAYAKGDGVPLDYVEAYKWLNIAAAQGASNAAEARNTISIYMTSAQIAQAQELSREFNPHKDNPVSSDNPTACGTGFFITDDGYLISNFHVVKDAAKIQLRTDAGLIPAKVVRTDAANDIALLKAEGKFSALPIAPSKAAGLGNSVFTLGFPDPGLQGFAPKLAKGEIASLSGAADDARYFQISVPVQPGNSGGALVDERGNVIGIVSAKLDASIALAASGALPENVNYAVKSSFVLSFLESAPDVSAKLKSPNTVDEKFSDAVKQAQDATVLVLVY
ncbi:MAG TPA: tetratricopeptide repeat-containing serine protease family protein [Verrucomicrobiae bacterium]|nr:tetratricopeptide repeat-containing serine protease family protein [Verrucomicrobiae bacterium]